MLRYFDHAFCKVHSLGPINVCTNFEINRCKIDEFIKHAKIGSKVMAQTVVLMFFMTLTLSFDLCSIDCHTVCMKYWNHLAKFHRNPSRVNG